MHKNIPLQRIETETTIKKNVSLSVLRIDLIHPEISGNKWFKLKYNIEFIKENNIGTLLTFGGAYSNHIAATAFAGKHYNIKTIGIIRGEEVDNSTLLQAKNMGMQLYFVPRLLFKNKDELFEHLQKNFDLPKMHIVPEGGSNLLGIKGCKEIMEFIPNSATHICCACGTGSTATGVLQSALETQKIIGFSSLKAEGYFEKIVSQFINDISIEKKITFNYNYHFGGYAKFNKELYLFTKEIKEKFNIQLDYVYTSKMLFGVMDLIKKDYFLANSEIIAIHTGGLQGNAGFDERILPKFKIDC
jgi:1-aminocyclopropane-1-carboxylate deaminase